MDRENIIFNIPKFKLRVTESINILKGRVYTDMHFHPEAEIMRVESGQVLCLCGQERLTLGVGDIIFVNGHTAHRIMPSDSPSQCSFMWFDTDFYTAAENSGGGNLKDFLKRSGGMPYVVLKKSENGEVSCLLDKISEEFSGGKKAYELCIRAHFFELAAILCRMGVIAVDNVDKKQISKIIPMTEYIDNNFRNKILLGDIAKYANIDKYYLCKLFKSICGATVVEYINFVRLLNAQDLLEGTAEPIAEIAFECGFSSVQYFNRVFKKYRDCSPRAYRQRAKKTVDIF